MYGADDARFAALMQDPAVFMEDANVVANKLLEPNAPLVEELRNAAPGTEKTKAAIRVNQFVDPLLQTASEKIQRRCPRSWVRRARACRVVQPGRRALRGRRRAPLTVRASSESYTLQWKQHFVQRVVDAAGAADSGSADERERGVRLILRSAWTPALSASMTADEGAAMAQSSTGSSFTEVPVLNEAPLPRRSRERTRKPRLPRQPQPERRLRPLPRPQQPNAWHPGSLPSSS